MLARSARSLATRHSRSCATVTKFMERVKSMEADMTKMSATFPDELKPIAEAGVRRPPARARRA